MADRIIQTETLQSIANSIRGSEQGAKIAVEDFAEKITEVAGGEIVLKQLLERNITDIVIPEGFTNLGNYAFAYCGQLQNVTFSKDILAIGQNAFYFCGNLKNIVIPDTVQYINSSAFNSCFNLENVVIGSGIQNIANYVFAGIKADAVINCKFSEGAVSGAPWGAPNGVTINYDYTGE